VGINGDVRFCCFWTGESIGNLKEKTIPEIWNHPEFIKLRKRISEGEIPSECRDCHLLTKHNKEEIRSRLNIELENIKKS
jgi:radical SAM protein with 4Fe4S-binding SPASM domain